MCMFDKMSRRRTHIFLATRPMTVRMARAMRADVAAMKMIATGLKPESWIWQKDRFFFWSKKIFPEINLSTGFNWRLQREVSYSALCTFLVGWHARSPSLPPGDVILSQLACSLNDFIFWFLCRKKIFPEISLSTGFNRCLQWDGLVTQLCVLFWLGGIPVLLACPQVMSSWPSLLAPRMTSFFDFCVEKKYFQKSVCRRVLIDVCREIGKLLGFVYFFGWVAFQFSLLALRWRHFGPASLPPELCHFWFTYWITNLSLYKHWV